MMWRHPPVPDTVECLARYGAVAQLFHWLTVALVLLLVPLGLTMTSLDAGWLQDALFTAHKSLGLTILMLTVIRLAWRWIQAPPPTSRDLSRFEMLTSLATHRLLYAVLLLMPISGYLMEVAGGFPLAFFGLDIVPRLLGKDPALAKLAEVAHLRLQYVIYALALLHAGAALHHHYRGHDVLRRMLPWTGIPGGDKP